MEIQSPKTQTQTQTLLWNMQSDLLTILFVQLQIDYIEA